MGTGYLQECYLLTKMLARFHSSKKAKFWGVWYLKIFGGGGLFLKVGGMLTLYVRGFRIYRSESKLNKLKSELLPET